MTIITFMLIFIYNVIFIYDVFKRKNFFGLGIIINFTINFNFIMLNLKWSEFVPDKLQLGTYILIHSIIVIFIIVMILNKSPLYKILNEKKTIRFKRFKFGDRNIDLYTIINLIYTMLFFIENYMGSGTLFPNLIGIDIHTYSAPLISFVTRSIFVMLFLNYICYMNFKKKRYILFFIIDIILFPVIRGARSNLFISGIQFIIFYLIYNLENVIKNKKKVAKVGIISIMIVVAGIYIGDKRIYTQQDNTGIQAKVRYEDYIRYTGPNDPFRLLSWYYGYFPVSIVNLDNSIQNIDENKLQTYGIYSLRPVLVNLLKVNKLVDNYPDYEYINKYVRVYDTGAATVATGFLDFYLDFNWLSFLPIMIYASISLIFYNNIRKNIFYLSFYSLVAGAWVFMCFQNMITDAITTYSLIFLYLIYEFLVIKNSEKNRIKVN